MAEISPIKFMFVGNNSAEKDLISIQLEKLGLSNEFIYIPSLSKALDYISNAINADSSNCPEVILINLNSISDQQIELVNMLYEHLGCEKTDFILMTTSEADEDIFEKRGLKVTHYERLPLDIEKLVGDFIRTGNFKIYLVKK